MSELLKAVEYAISPQARQDKLSLAIMGLSRQGLVDAEDLFSLNNPFFSHLPAAQGESAATSTATTDVSQLIRSASTMQDARTLIGDALIIKCASFLDRPVEELAQNQPLSEIGFDSLVSIELNNWILRTFDSPIQTADIASATSVIALTKIITNRSRLIAEGAKSKVETEQPKVNGVQKTTNGFSRGLQDFKCCIDTPPPKLPLTSIEDFLDRYLGNCRSVREE